MNALLILMLTICLIGIIISILNLSRLNIKINESNTKLSLLKDLTNENLKLLQEKQELEFDKIVLAEKIKKINDLVTSNTYGNVEAINKKIKEVIQSTNKNNF